MESLLKGMLLGIAYVTAALVGMTITTFGQDELPRAKQTREVTIYSAVWCIPCQEYKEDAVQPLLKEGYKIKTLDKDEEKAAGRWVPSLIPYTMVRDPKTKKVTRRIVGKLSKSHLRSLLEN